MTEAMQDELTSLLSVRRGHFRLESGHHTDMWIDIDTLFVHPVRLRPFARALALRLAMHEVEVMCGPVIGGALLAQMIATELDLEFFLAERVAPPQPEELFSVRYRVPDRTRSWLGGKRVAVVDDVISAGSAVRATLTDLASCGARPVAIASLMVMGYAAPHLAAAQKLPLETIATLPRHMWEPKDCPLCAAKMALESPEGL